MSTQNLPSEAWMELSEIIIAIVSFLFGWLGKKSKDKIKPKF